MTKPDCGDDCTETLREIERFLDGETSVSVGETIERHLSDCSPCMERAEFRRSLKAMLAAKCRGGDEVPQELRERIVAIIRHDEQPA
jgi:mycothiol system anti-sigma-R factor